ncbi:2-dehydropantoate 2-reductase [Methylorubrum populi BJ001]|jgi:2-dehydropantoate 2-reductase|uniref:2-dehydropantoate 2-reductase n=1 Tax=Methylorubrum populi (strain ATCC BAA-705 / NCIMB 13946 / BJ001) TaxID=441620 RepID=B1ZGN8_METPB|nr:2-dehydropantoate 2-reductase [Methylorubrum populi]ACB81271.1 2-dehydropantoate 2-reductase [Methylorubrum populi BJ001]OAH38037.1 2-dehydropantoate 2-reductase [Methylorubrum populi]PZP66920.1 MAG: 2-dehydropantoate 2-reductase [Methylorubrum populi]
MRILVVGAGATGGYFGARLLEAGRDVTFLVRPARAEKLAAQGLSVRSPVGDLHIDAPKTVTADGLAEAGPFDLVLLSAKAYDLDTVVADVAPAVGAGTAVLPILNGLRHLDVLDRAFGAEKVLGGSCGIVATLTRDGEIRQMTELHTLTYGERDGTRSERIARIEAQMEGARFQARASDKILLEMWEKWVFLATLAGATTLMRAAVGDIVAAPGGPAFIEALHDECQAVAVANGYGAREKVFAGARKMLTAEGSAMTASMLRDIEGNARIEADHIVGDLIERGRANNVATPVLERVLTHLKAYEHRRAREAA